MSAVDLRPTMVSGENDLLIDTNGKQYIDLFSGNGTSWLGHSHPVISNALAEQSRRLLNCGALPTPALNDARRELESWLPESHEVKGFYSTGMEAVEFAFRIARRHTQRQRAAGFARSMHGKSLMASSLAWDNPDASSIPQATRLPFVANNSEDFVLGAVREHLNSHDVAALFVEPVQVTAGGHRASLEFYNAIGDITSESNTLLVYDELLTGFYRTGPRFFFEDTSHVPDLIVLGKSLGNGFPVSAVVGSRDIPVRPEMLPGSTFAGNPLASATVGATLAVMRSLSMTVLVDKIHATITRHFADLTANEGVLRGSGALWILELSPMSNVQQVLEQIYTAGVCVGYCGRLIRLLPAVTIDQERLKDACQVIRSAVASAASSDP